MKKKYTNPTVEIYNISKEEEVITASGDPALAKYGLGWFLLPTDDSEFTA